MILRCIIRSLKLGILPVSPSIQCLRPDVTSTGGTSFKGFLNGLFLFISHIQPQTRMCAFMRERVDKLTLNVELLLHFATDAAN